MRQTHINGTAATLACLLPAPSGAQSRGEAPMTPPSFFRMTTVAERGRPHPATH
jgi:hypothetical protein